MSPLVPTIVVNDVSKRYGKIEALKNVSLQVEQGCWTSATMRHIR
ncbi:MAG: hypothetical protein O3B04_10270 [Chloroflexi bacterium]|nr:hypothetical protein [Chloroflexota bacterium]